MEEYKCIMCHKLVDIDGDEIEYDEDGNIWCSPCFIEESDTGN